MHKHPYKTALQKHTFIDLFAGIGGFHLALDSFGTECVFASDWDTDAQRVYHDNFGVQPQGDITKIDTIHIPPHDILCAGFPCQAFSISGKQRGFNDIRGGLFFDVARIVKHHKPKILLLENVKNLAHHDNGNTLKTIEKTLQDMGYIVYHKILNVGDFNIPQNRHRIYIVCVRNDIQHTDFIFPTPPKKSVTLEQFLGDSQANIQTATIDKKIQWHENKESLLFPQNKPIRIGTYGKGGQGERVYSVQGHAITLSAYGGGIGAKTGLYKVGDTVRKLTPTECAKISGFPKNYKISKNKNSAYKQFGNTVVVDVLQYIIIALMEQNII